ncbi:uncharacterized protein LOC144880240 [Branchiostoma floridae x Branchiostoma japonicum]
MLVPVASCIYHVALGNIYDHYDAKQVEKYVNDCSAQNSQVQHNQPISVNQVFKRLGIDFTTIDFNDGSPKRRVLYAIDYFSRFAWGWVMPTTDDNEEEQVSLRVAKILLNLCLTLGIVWEELQSDNGSEFVSHVVRELMKALGVKIVLANPRSPTTGGRFERGIQTIKTKVSACLAQSRVDCTAKMTPQEVLQKALYDYNNDDMEEALAEVSSVTEAATVASLVAEGKIATRNEQVTHFFKAGDDGYLKLDIKDRRGASSTTRRQVRVRVLDVRQNLLSLEVLKDTGETTGMVLKRRYHVSQLIFRSVNRQSQEREDGTESGMAAWRRLYGSQREMAGRVLSAGLNNKALLFYATELEGGALTSFAKRGESLLISWYQAMQRYMWAFVPHHLQTAFELGIVLMLIDAGRQQTLTLQVPEDCPQDIQPHLKEITKFQLPSLSSDWGGDLSTRIVPAALTGFVFPDIKESRLQELSVYLRVPASHRCDICKVQRPMWQYWRCTGCKCNAACCMECVQKLQAGCMPHDHTPTLQEDISDTRGPTVGLQGSQQAVSVGGTEESENGTTDEVYEVHEVTLAEAIMSLDGKVITKTPGQKCCSCSKAPVCASGNCNCKKRGTACSAKCKCAKKKLGCQNKNSGQVKSKSTASNSPVEFSWRRVDLLELLQSIQTKGDRPDVLEQRAQTAGLKFRTPTPKDGNCFFWAVSDQLQREELKQEGAEQMTQEDIRKSVTSYIRDHPNTADGEPLASFIPGSSLEEYLAKMSEDGAWADHICVQATADFLGRPVSIVSTSGKDDECFIFVQPQSGDSDGSSLLLGHYSENHYQSLDTTAALESPTDCGEAGSFHDDEVSIDKQRHTLLGPETVGKTPPVGRREMKRDAVKVWGM